MKYRVMTVVSSLEDGRPLLHETNSLDEAKRECAEWALEDDILVWVLDEDDQTIFEVDGYTEALDILEPEE